MNQESTPSSDALTHCKNALLDLLNSTSYKQVKAANPTKFNQTLIGKCEVELRAAIQLLS